MLQLSLTEQASIFPTVHAALSEDLGGNIDLQLDITASLIPENQTITATILTREDCVLCGQPWVNAVFQTLGDAQIDWQFQDGDKVKANTVLCQLSGNARQLLTGERTALNLLQTLSGTATLTQHYVQQLTNTNTRLLDTRKTLPGLRLAQKYAVRCGGGHNHRIGLYDAFLIKENHIAACGGIQAAIAQAKHNFAEKPVEIEVETLAQLEQAIQANADIVMLDNFTLDAMRQAVQLTQGRCKLEASGNVSLDTLATIAQTGVDYISVGALTKHVQAIDLSFRVCE